MTSAAEEEIEVRPVVDQIAEQLLGRIFWALVALLFMTGSGLLGGAFWLGSFTTEMRGLSENVEEIRSAFTSDYGPRLVRVEQLLAVGVLPEAKRRLDEHGIRIRVLEKYHP